MTDYQTYLLLQFLCWYPRKIYGSWYTTSSRLSVIRYFCKSGSAECPEIEAIIQSRTRPGHGRVILEKWQAGELVYKHPEYQAIIDESQERMYKHFISRGYLPQYKELLNVDDR